MYERFSDRARKVMQLANQEAQRLNHEITDTEHVLLGLVKEGQGWAALLLQSLHVDPRTIRLEVEKRISVGLAKATVGKLPQTPEAKQVIQFAMEEASERKDDCVGTKHFLLGLLRVRSGLGAQVLVSLGVDLEIVREKIVGRAKPAKHLRLRRNRRSYRIGPSDQNEVERSHSRTHPRRISQSRR